MQVGVIGAPRHPGPRQPSAAMVVAPALALILTMTACAQAGSPSPSATVEPSSSGAGSPSAGPAASDTPSPAGTPDAATRPTFEQFALVTVRIGTLDVHVDHTRSAPMLDDPFAGGTMRLVRGDHVLVMSAPTWTDGRWWLQIATDHGNDAVGWVVTGTPSDPNLEQDDAWCPTDPSFADLVALTHIEQRGCYGAARLTFDAYRASVPPDGGLGGACDPGPYPEWLVCDNINYNYVNGDGGYDWELKLHFDPARGISPTGLYEGSGTNPLLHITGHFADPAADQCAPTAASGPGDWGTRWLDCTTDFVVEKIE